MPNERIFVAVLANSDSPHVTPNFVSTRMALDAAGVDYPKFAAIEVDEEVLAEYVGVYRINDTDTRKVTLEDGQLFTQRSGGDPLPVVPHGKDAFYYEASFTHLTFDREDGEIVAMSVYQNGAEEAEQAPLVDEEHSE